MCPLKQVTWAPRLCLACSIPAAHERSLQGVKEEKSRLAADHLFTLTFLALFLVQVEPRCQRGSRRFYFGEGFLLFLNTVGGCCATQEVIYTFLCSVPLLHCTFLLQHGRPWAAPFLPRRPSFVRFIARNKSRRY